MQAYADFVLFERSDDRGRAVQQTLRRLLRCRFWHARLSQAQGNTKAYPIVARIYPATDSPLRKVTSPR